MHRACNHDPMGPRRCPAYLHGSQWFATMEQNCAKLRKPGLKSSRGHSCVRPFTCFFSPAFSVTKSGSFAIARKRVFAKATNPANPAVLDHIEMVHVVRVQNGGDTHFACLFLLILCCLRKPGEKRHPACFSPGMSLLATWPQIYLSWLSSAHVLLGILA